MIPKKIHYCWVGGGELPELAKKCIKSWKKYCPDYEIIEWNESNYDFTKIPYMKEAYEAKKWGFVPDYARLEIIYEHGGIYLDTDVEILKPIDELLLLEAFAGFEKTGFEREKNVALGLGFGAQRKHEMIKVLMNSYMDMHFINDDGSMNVTPSPQQNSKTLEAYGLCRTDIKQVIHGLTIFPSEYFCPRVGYGGKRHITQNTYMDHHYDGSWADETQKKNWTFCNRAIDRQLRKEKIIKIPNRVVKKILGELNYEKIKIKLKKGKR